MKEIIKNDAMKISQADTEYVYDENGLTYTEGEDGMLYPLFVTHTISIGSSRLPFDSFRYFFKN